MQYLTEILDSGHDRKNFSCGEPSLDYYIRFQAGQDMRRKLSVCFVLPTNNKDILGYYTLSTSSISSESLPNELRSKLPVSYRDLPVILLGRLAVDKSRKGIGTGKLLLIDALKRSFDTSLKIGAMAVVVSPLNDNARSFYEKYGFTKLPDSGKMFLSMKTISLL